MKRLRTFVLCSCLFLLPASAAAEAVIGIYGVASSPAKERTAASAAIREAGANAVFVPADGDAIRHYRKLGLRVFVALNAFGGSGGWKKFPDARPVKADGRLLGTAPEDKGQEGMCPSHAGWRKDRIGQIESVVKRFGTEIDGIFLDYVRYPGFWEKPAPNLPDTCYCARCLEKFRADTRIRIADRRAFDTAPAAWIAKHHPYEWMKWKKGQIASFVREAKESMLRQAQHDKLLLGLFVVPWTKGEKNADVSYKLGQDAAYLSEFADVLSPMAYHRMCGEAPAWVEKTTAYFKESVHCAVWPIVQATDTDAGELADALRNAGKGGADGVLVFHYGGMQKAKDPAAMWKALAAFSTPRNLLPNPGMRVTAGASAPEGWRFGKSEKTLDSRFRGNDILRQAQDDRTADDKSAPAGMIKSAAVLDAKMARPSPANAVGITGSRDGVFAWGAEIPACKPGEEYLFTGFFYRDHWDNLSYPKVSVWGEAFELDNHVFFLKSFQPLRAHIPCPPGPAEGMFRFINDAPDQTFWMAKPSLLKKEPSPRGADTAVPQLFAGFFPIGVWGATRNNLEQIKSLGINTVLLRDEGEELRQTVRRCRELALRFVLSVPQEPERLRIYLDGLADLKLTEHEAAFYVEDEPELRSVPIGRTEDVRRMIRDRFPGIATCMAIVRPQACRDYLAAAHFFMMDQYPVPFRPMTLLADSMDRAAQDTGRERLLSIIQAFGGGDEAAVGRTRWPTWEEMDCLAFLSVIHGSRGVFFFSFSDMGRNEDGRERLARVTGRLNAVYPWLQKHNDKDEVGVKMISDWRVDPKGRPAVQAVLKTKDGERLLIAVNTIGHRVSAELTVPVDTVPLPPFDELRAGLAQGDNRKKDEIASAAPRNDKPVTPASSSVTPASSSVIPASSSVTPASSSVTPAKAGVQRPDYAPGRADRNPRHWIPASAGMTREGAGMTDKDLDSRFRGNDRKADEVFGSGAYPISGGVIRASFAPFETKAFLIKAAGKR